MTEAEWMEGEEPSAMVGFLDERVAARKARLFACACLRQRTEPLLPWERGVLAIAERDADGSASTTEVEAALTAALPSNSFTLVFQTRDWWSAVKAARAVGEGEKEAVQCELVRDIFGNPFRRVVFSSEWRTDTVVSLAKQMYDSRDFGAMPILADALQDAGCDSDDILSHCRGDGPHVRGCWVVDLVLGKE
jgi:hypothetical protein